MVKITISKYFPSIFSYSSLFLLFLLPSLLDFCSVAEAAPPTVAVGLTSAEMGLLINDNDPYSVAVGNYYIAKRNIPAANVVHVQLPFIPSTPVSPSVNGWDANVYNKYQMMTKPEFDVLKAQVDAALPSTVQAIAIAWMGPSKVADGAPVSPRNYNSITSALARGIEIPTGSPGTVSCGIGIVSPYYNSNSTAPFKDFGNAAFDVACCLLCR